MEIRGRDAAEIREALEVLQKHIFFDSRPTKKNAMVVEYKDEKVTEYKTAERKQTAKIENTKKKQNSTRANNLRLTFVWIRG